MKKLYFTIFCLLISFGATAQTLTTSGDWGVASNWSTNNVPDQLTEDVSFNQKTNATIGGGNTYSVGKVDLANQNNLTIESGARLNVGTTTANRNFTTNNDAFLYVYGDLYIYGDLVVNNNLTLVVTGTMYVSGNVVLKNGGSLDVSGKLSIGGDFVGGNNTSLNVDGTLDIGGSATVGAGSTLTGTGTVNVSGSCTDDGTGSFCTAGPLPVTLLYFTAKAQNKSVEISWASSKAWDFSHYELERSADGKNFEFIATIEAEEFSNETVAYAYSDHQPLFGTSYYRLKAVDIDGSFEYKEMTAVKFGAESFKVYPNPSEGGVINVDWSHATDGAIITLTDNTGRTVRSVSHSSGQRNAFSTEGLTAGMYVLSIKSVAGTKQTQVLIK